jgi:hypothetical protein
MCLLPLVCQRFLLHNALRAARVWARYVCCVSIVWEAVLRNDGNPVAFNAGSGT